MIGSGRSGTTLVRRILTSAPGVHVPPETYVLGEAIRDYRRLGREPWDLVVDAVLARFEYHPEFRHFDVSLRPLAQRLRELPARERSLAAILDGFYRFHGEAHGVEVRRWGDKTPINTFHLRAIDSVFPRARYVHVLRDPADVVASYLDMGRYPTARAAARRWATSVRAAERFGRRHPERSMLVRYEDLVGDPETASRELCAFLDVPFDASMLESEPRAELMGDAAALGHHRAVADPIDDASVGKGRRTLTRSQLRSVQRRAGRTLARMGYEPCA